MSGCLCRIRVFDFLQIFSRNAVGICFDLLQSSYSNDPAAVFSATGSHINDVIGIADHIQIMFNDKYRCPIVYQRLKYLQQGLYI